MQIPRGTFLALKREVETTGMIDSLKSEGFNGYTTVSTTNGPATLIFDQGVLRFAEFGTSKGNEAVKRLIAEEKKQVDAEIFTLTRAQLELCAQFNPACIVSERKVIPKARQDTQAAPLPAGHKETPVQKERRRRRPSPPAPDTMQLPRGTFSGLNKGVIVAQLFESLRTSRFTGYSAISWPEGKATVVFEEGALIMAQVPPERGDAAAGSLASIKDSAVDAELYTFSELQMKMVRDSNSAFEISDKVGSLQPPLKMQKLPEKPHKYVPHSPGGNDEDNEEVNEFDEQIRALEEMDLDLMTDRFRDNFKEVLKKMQLHHLIDEDDKKAE